MFEELKNKGKHIVLINSEGLSFYNLSKDVLSLMGHFSAEDSGYTEFQEFLADKSKLPVTLLVDLATEDFVVENVAHVGPMDRKVFLNRKTEQHFRGVDYRSARIIGREPEGRRDDRVLFSAITKNQAVEPWIRALLREEIPIVSITSPAYALCNVAEEYGMLTHDSVLLVNWESSGIRQTFLVDGKTRFSRLTPPLKGSQAEVPRELMTSCNQSREYLERIGLLDPENKSDVHIITPHFVARDFTNLDRKGNFRSVTHHRSMELAPAENFDGKHDAVTAVVLCLDWGVRKGQHINIYGNSLVRRFHTLMQTRKLLSFTCLALLGISTLISAPLIFDGIASLYHTVELRQQLRPVKATHDNLLAGFPETPIPSDTMELAVRTYDKIKAHQVSPFEALASVSRVLLYHPSVELDSVDWELTPEMENRQRNTALTTLFLEGESALTLHLDGVLVRTISIQDSDRRLQRFVSELEAIEGFTVEAVQRPLEADPLSEVSAVINDEAVDAEFSLTIRVES